MREYRQRFINGLRNHTEIPSSEYLGKRYGKAGSPSKTATNGMFIMSDPWTLNEDNGVEVK